MFHSDSNKVQEFYHKLVELCNIEESPFFYIDEEYEFYKIRIFSYRLASWGDFNKYKPYSYWCRGTTFNITNEDKVRLICLPFRKFFNINETPDTMYEQLQYKKVAWISNKLDGSLISVCRFPGFTSLKTKQTLFSQQALDARHLYYHTNDFRSVIDEFYDYEYCAPNNQIVVRYNEPKLTLLESRTLGFHPFDKICVGEWLQELDTYLFTSCNFEISEFGYGKSLKELNIFQKYIENNKSHEGVVITFLDGTKVKWKTDWYISQHRLKDQLYNKKYIVECILNESIDDLLSQLNDENYKHEVQKDIIKIRNYITQKENKIHQFIQNHKDLCRKDYAIAAKQELFGTCEFQTAMKHFPNMQKQGDMIIMSKYYYMEFDFGQIMKDNLDKFVYNNELILE